MNSRREFAEELVKELREDFLGRQEARRGLELQWRLNQSFLAGRPAVLTSRGELEEEERRFDWESRECFNHIAPIVETRCAKLARVQPAMTVRSAGGKEDDIYAAKLSTKLLKSLSAKIDLPGKLSRAASWSETLGTAFYRLGWGEEDAQIEVIPAYEVYPFDLCQEDLHRQPSVMLARAVLTEEIFDRYGVHVEPEETESFGADFRSERLTGYVRLIERLERPTKSRPRGRYLIAAGTELLFDGELPYRLDGEDGWDYPLVKQCSVAVPGRFFGQSVVERLIPIQRAYNAVKNRKYEFLSRIAAGVYAVEDGSVDTEELEEEGLRPGRLLVYRQGSRPPFVLDYSRVPTDFSYEEERLQNEFIRISGVSEITRNSELPSGMLSGVALSILVEQDDTRLSVTAEHIRSAVKTLSGHLISLYRQFATGERLLHAAGEAGELECVYFKGSDLCADELRFDADNELLESPAQKKSYLFDLLKSGLFLEEDGRLSGYTRAKILDMLGFGTVENGQELVNLHVGRAAGENVAMLKEDAEISEVDDHALHIKEHVKYMLANALTQNERFLRHVRAHRLLSEPAGEESEHG